MSSRHRTTFRVITLVLLAAFLSSCTSTASQKLVAFPTQGQDMTQQLHDKMECEQIATQNRGDEATDVTAGAAKGVAIGALSGAAIGLVGGAIEGTLRAGLVGFAIGAVAGMIGGAFGAWQEHGRHYHDIYVKCLAARGYLVGG